MTNKRKKKVDRLRTALAVAEPDRVPASDFFWTGFVNRCKEK